MPSVLIADDHPVVLEGLVSALRAVDGMRILGVCSTAGDVLKHVRDKPPDVLLLDIRLGEDDGLDVMAAVRRANRSVRVILLTMMDDPMTVRRAHTLRADGYFLKTAPLEDLAGAVHTVARGKQAWDPQLIAVLAAKPEEGRRGILDQLTYQEAQIVDHLTRGLTNREIAARMKLSEKTVRNYLSRVMDKTGTRRRAEVAALYVRALNR